MSNAVPNLGLAFAVTTTDSNNRIMNGAGKAAPRWPSDSVAVFPTATSIAAAQAGTSFLSSSLAGLTPMTFANTTLAATGRNMTGGNAPVVDPMLVFAGEPAK